jgi:uncharacterized RDD family membrane protein YckC
VGIVEGAGKGTGQGSPAVDRVRIRAGFVDFIAVFVVAAIVGDELHFTGGAAPAEFLGVLVAFNVLYHGVMELTVGRSLGKRWAGLQIVSVDGSRLTTGQVVLRNLARVIDILPNLYIFAVVLVWAAPERSQRLGDRLARTQVRLATR